MVAARVRVDPRRAAEFSHADHERVLEQAALRQVVAQRGDGGVCRRDEGSDTNGGTLP